jgi:nicotinamide mononucleotide adenylyltransferase
MNLQNQPRYQRMLDAGAANNQIINAGFFQESAEVIDVPLPNISEGVIIFLTGCFAPIHAGHIQAMADAKVYVETVLKKKVAVGFFGFCHDEYVSTKTKDWPYSRRKEYFENHPLKEDWMVCLEYEALVEKYNRETIMLCGADNQDFHKVFSDDEIVIVFKRDLRAIDPMPSNVIVLESRNQSMSSSKIRNAALVCNP